MSETNSYKKATDSPVFHVLTLTAAQLARIEIALEDHVQDLEEREARDPDCWTDELETARRTLALVQEA